MNSKINGLYGIALLWLAVGLGGCASSTTATGEPGVKMGDSYEHVLRVVSRNNAIIKSVDGQGFRAEGYSPLFKDCRTKYFIFQGTDGLQRVSFEPAPHLSINQNCRQP
ncbi:hypothetical protein [Pseudomonas syringae group genomosp. 3]|uniref:hypothetical protein n=1 Tax=Pseudomonas syringae group genomosp. 3 TaxID=251701 RepID=UPI000EFAE224|nr:hypothetical protein [Pseudomonas syringae group genomosp. 3]